MGRWLLRTVTFPVVLLWCVFAALSGLLSVTLDALEDSGLGDWLVQLWSPTEEPQR